MEVNETKEENSKDVCSLESLPLLRFSLNPYVVFLILWKWEEIGLIKYKVKTAVVRSCFIDQEFQHQYFSP
jgi:hypothetical protein